jgi:hypothetical protein
MQALLCCDRRVRHVTMRHKVTSPLQSHDRQPCAPVGSGVAKSEDATKIECALWNASIGGYKDALPAFRSTDDDEDEGGGEDQVDARMSDDLSFGGVGSVGASHESDSNPVECSGQGTEEQYAEMEGDKAVDLLAHDIDPYEDAMRDDSDGGF